MVDRCAFTTSQERSLQALYGEGPDQELTYEQQLRTTSTRLVTLLAALKVRAHTILAAWYTSALGIHPFLRAAATSARDPICTAANPPGNPSNPVPGGGA